MALSDLERLRLQIQDRPRVALREVLGYGDGAELNFLTQLHPVAAESEAVTVNGVLKTPGTDYTLDDAVGLLTFTVAPATGAAVRVTYRWSTFNDAELEDLLAQHGSVRRAAIAALEMLLADSERFLKYTFGQESVDRTATRDALAQVIARLEKSGDGPVSLVKADTPYRAGLLAPYLPQVPND